MNNFFASIPEAVQQLKASTGEVFTVMMQQENMSVEYFAPQQTDNQKPHQQDELYIIASGNSQFNRNGEIINCTKGDVIFVPAGMKHFFLNISEDFATWVIFYGEKKYTP